MQAFMVNSAVNPYIRLLGEALSLNGVIVNRMPFQLKANWLRESRTMQPSILHFHWPGSSYTKISWAETKMAVEEWLENLYLARRLGYRIVWTAHNIFPHDDRHADLQRLARNGLIKNCDYIITHCEKGRDSLVANFASNPEQISVFPHPGYVGVYGDERAMAEARQYLMLEQDSFVFLFFGRVHPYKGLNELVKTFSKIRSIAKISLLIAGDPQNAAIGRSLMRQSLEMDGLYVHPFSIPDQEVSYYFGAANVIVLPYQEILSSGVTALSFSLSRGVVGPSTGCMSEALAADRGWLYSIEEPGGLEGALLAAHHSDWMARGLRGRQYVEQFTWAKFGEFTSKVYLQACRR